MQEMLDNLEKTTIDLVGQATSQRPEVGAQLADLIETLGKAPTLLGVAFAASVTAGNTEAPREVALEARKTAVYAQAVIGTVAEELTAFAELLNTVSKGRQQ